MRCGRPSLRPVPRRPLEVGARGADGAAGVSAAGTDVARWNDRAELAVAKD